MEFDIKEIGVTVFIGAYFLFGIEVLFYLFFSSNVFLTIEKETRFTSRSLIVLALTLSFAFGMLIEDVSNKFVDKDEPWQTFMVSLFPPHLSDDEIKFQTFFGKDGSVIGGFAPEMSRLGLLKVYGGVHGADVQTAVDQKETIEQLDQKKLMAVAKQLYYHAKNRVYREPTYYDELKEIQLRIDFARSYLAISFFLIPIAILLASVKLVPLVYQSVKVKRGRLVEATQARKSLAKLVGSATCTIVCLIASCLLGTYAFVSEEIEFDNRAYGYFSSINVQAEPQKDVPEVVKPAPSPTP